MKRKWTFLILLALCLLELPASGETINDLLDAAAHHPNVEISELAAKEGNLRVEAANAALRPKIDFFAKAEYYGSPTNLRPMVPNEVAAGDSLPFSRPLARYGLSFQAPLYVAKIYRLREKMTLLAQKSRIAQQINLVSREAAVVSLNSAFRFLEELVLAVDSRLKSLAQTRNDLVLKVKNGRTPEAELMKVDNSIIALEEQKNDLAEKILNVQSDLEKFTDVSLPASLKMALANDPEGAELISLSLQEKEMASQEKEVERVHAERLPAISLYGTISGNDGEAYNTDTHIFREYNFAGVGLTMPIYDRVLTSNEAIALIQLKKSQKRLKESEIELTSQAKNLKARLPIIEKSRQLAEKSAKNNQELLKIARVAYDSGRTPIEEYLRYEAQVLASQADLAKAVDAKWQILTKQAVLYGTDLRGVVK